MLIGPAMAGFSARQQLQSGTRTITRSSMRLSWRRDYFPVYGREDEIRLQCIMELHFSMKKMDDHF
jgi:hypothetical protein